MRRKKSRMRKTAVLLPFVLALLLTGCTGSAGSADQPGTEQTETDLLPAEENFGEETDIDSSIREAGTVKTYFEEIYSETVPNRLLVSIDLKWLQVDDRFEGADKINEYLTDCQMKNIAYEKENMEWLTEEEDNWKEEEDIPWTLSCSYQSGLTELSYFDEHYISFCQSEYDYSGGAHGMPDWIGFTFDLETGERLTIADVVADSEEELKDIVTGYFEDMIAENPDIYWENALDTVRENTGSESSFYLTEEGIEFYFLPYDLASYADGFQTVNIPYGEFGLKISLENALEEETRPAAVVKTPPEGGELVFSSEDWGLSFGESGTQPVGNAPASELAWYDAYYVGSDSEKVVYLTFDCGYENGNTEPILDALKKHNAKGTFFVVGHFLETAPELAKRMVEEGHAVGNHTYHHLDMPTISDMETFRKEMDDVADLFYEITGTKLSPYYRPPQGKCNTQNLKMAQELGYCTIFWSLAHVDWDQNNQPGREESISKLTSRVHPGAIVLLHNTSSTNGKILDELLTKWEEMGYTFKPLSDLTGK